MSEQKEQEFDAMDPLASISQATAEDIKQVQESTGFSYENYVSIPKVEVAPVLKVLDSLSKIATDSYAKNVYVTTDSKQISFKYNNDPYIFEYRIENRSGKVIQPIAVAINTVRKLLNNVNTNLILVQKDNETSVCIGENLLYLETIPVDETNYNFKFADCKEQLDLPYMRDHLRSFSQLLSSTNNASEKNVICKDGYSYFNVGAVLGKAKSFFGNHTMVVSKICIDAITALAEDTKTGALINVEGDTMTLDFLGVAKCRLPITASESVFETFMSPLFLNAFKYEQSVMIVNESLKQLLSVVGALDYFTSFVNLEFKEKEFVLTTHRKEGSDVSYTFEYLEGEAVPNSMNIAIPVLLAVLNKADNTTRYSTTQSNLVVNLGSVVYCIRSNS